MSTKNLDTIISKVVSDAHKNNISKVLVALSGGADSICTAYALKAASLEIQALHCNFHLRGEESNRDMNFVSEFCLSQDIPLEIIEFNVKEYLEVHKGISLEMACRDLRHKWFESMLEEKKFDRIATGHNADDNIETFLLNMIRGSGSRGLKGMISDNGKIWRPLLSFHRNEILSFLQDNKLSFIVDSTNLISDFRRNFLRNEVIPILKKEWKGFDKGMERTIENIESENRIVEYCLNQILENRENELEIKEILGFPAPKLLIKRFLSPLEPFTTTPEEILSAIYAKKPHIRKWRLRNGNAYLRNGKLFIEMVHSESSS